MWVGALLDLGLPLEEVQARIDSLGLPSVAVSAQRVARGSLWGTHFAVVTPSTALNLGVVAPSPGAGPKLAPHRHRGLAEIRAILAAADLPGRVRERACEVFTALAEAEAKVHRTSIEAVHFHEVGAEDAIVDIVTVTLGTELLGIERYVASAIVVGTGTVRCEHGVLPVPAPATLELLQGIPIRAGERPGERTTPTGAALLKVLVSEFARPIAYVPERVGYGAGTRDDPSVPNLLRITLGTTTEPGSATALCEIACTLDTASGELLAYLIEGCMQRGAVDAFAGPVTMKKGRPGHVLSVLTGDGERARIVGFLLEESGTLGVRMHRAERTVLERWNEERTTSLGSVRMKCARLPSGQVVTRPEEAEVLRLVATTGLSRHEVVARISTPLV